MTGPRDHPSPTGSFTTLDGEEYYRISAYHRMPPFFMSIPSDTDLWLFIASSGGLTGGRVDADGSLFPYEPVDKLLDGHHVSGPITLVRVRWPGGRDVLWEPFSPGDVPPGTERNLYKNTVGNRIVFEELRPDLGLSFRYRWSAGDAFGLVRTAILRHLGGEPVSISLLDGLRNVLPYGVPLSLYRQSSCLVDAYKRVDYDPETGLGIFSLTAKILDRAEPGEVLRANTVWRSGLERARILLSDRGIEAFRRGEPVREERVLTGRRGNYLCLSTIELAPGSVRKWHLVADVARSHVQIADLRARLRSTEDLDPAIEHGLGEARENLLGLVAGADGLQHTGHREATAHHFANVLFNGMRGGFPFRNYDVPMPDFLAFLTVRNRVAASRCESLLRTFPAEVSIGALHRTAEQSGDPELQRLCLEYLPLHFSRRHGDPSRPWNTFSIRVRHPDGSRALCYEGNWRDIFQNWEALTFSFPELLPNIIAKFVNASTVDGFNPYRIGRDGIAWEIEDPANPWAQIGYWGDHQIAYLLAFLEAEERFSPGALAGRLDHAICTYAQVPYRLASYERMLENPRRTILFDTDLAADIDTRVDRLGSDGKLVPDRDGAVLHVTLLEKLIVPALSKLSNLVPDGGIWMNTQRPEWNDANNALAGSGLSVVTACYLRRYLVFLEGLLETREETTAALSAEVAEWLDRMTSALDAAWPAGDAPGTRERDRKRFLDAVGEAFTEYRDAVYAGGLSGGREVPVSRIVAFCRVARRRLDWTIRANRRTDGLYHAYNLLEIGSDGRTISVRPLYEMLEGQVAVLNSGLATAEEAAALVESLFESRMYCRDRDSFLLYPERALPGFVERNLVPEERVRAVPLLHDLLESGDVSLLDRDAEGTFRFQGDLGHADDVEAKLAELGKDDRWRTAVERDRGAVLEVFEGVFSHRAFTGRSGTMYAYEGLGSVYWHMVAKLLLAIQEILLREIREGGPSAATERLTRAYFRVRRGLGFEKTASAYGAFPTDPYSHTPRHAGAQQPGMTGQVKEGILARFGELGLQVEGGSVAFRPVLLRRSEFLRRDARFEFRDLEEHSRPIDLLAGSLAFSFCQVPIVYSLIEGEPWITVALRDGETPKLSGYRLGTEHSRPLFRRDGTITRIDVGIPRGWVLDDRARGD